MLCNDCDKRDLCVALCPEAEVYASQDHVAWDEAPITHYYNGDELRVFDADTGVEKPLFTPMEKAVLSRLACGKTRFEIAKELKISREYLRKVIHTLRSKALPLSA